MSAQCQLRITLLLCVILAMIQEKQLPAEATVRDLCQSVPTTSNSFCTPTTVDIYYDPETQKCRYIGCSKKKHFTSLGDCEKICNNARHVLRRIRTKANETTHST